MNKQTTASLLLLCLCVASFNGCSTTATSPVDGLATSLPKLTAAATAALRYGEPGVALSDEQLLTAAVKDKPELGKAFAGYPVRIHHDAKHLVILVCSRDGKTALLEDASWTPGVVDHKWYMTKPPKAPDFTMLPTEAP